MRLIDADLLKEEIHCSYSDDLEILDKIDKQPTVNQWIPCSERLPEENGHYLVTYHCKSYGNYLPDFDDTYVRKMRFQNSKWMMPFNIDKEAEADEFKEVIAWKPLPEPYKEK